MFSNFRFNSKTLWANAIAIALLIAERAGYVAVPLDPGSEALILAVLNMVLRFVTKQPLFGPTEPQPAPAQ